MSDGSTKNGNGRKSSRNPEDFIQIRDMNESSKNSISSIDDWLCSTVCLFSGMLTFFVYYQMTLSFVALNAIWPNQIFSDLLGGCEYIAAAIVSFIMLPYNAFRIRYFFISCFIYIAVALAFPMIVTFLSGMRNFPTARALLICVSLITGAADGMQGLAGFSMAATLIKSRVGIVSGGSGLSGAVPWVIFLIMSQLIFEKSVAGQKQLIGAFFSIAALLSIVQLVCVAILQRRPWFIDCITKAARHHEAQFVPGQNRWKQIFLCGNKESIYPNDSNEEIGVAQPEDHQINNRSARSFGAVLKDCWLHAFSALLLIIITMMLFPLVAPYGFHQNYFWTTMLNGIGQLGHTFMRFAPVYFSFLNIRPHWLLPAIIIRCLFFMPLFIVINRLSNTPVLHSPWFLVLCMLGFSGTHGWAGTLTSIYTVASVSDPQEKAMASKILIISQLIACGVGQFAGKLTVL